ncbi:C-X-C chemokine receptor type 2-like [Platichthys flesus]|uniref:C-X-C chemokine receptor type 2-like n=1 Tax=Platichthys flesus TaxID=8260 RepID=UPI002DBDFC82|nr:C-X-C chemokine receptor type 2-like [Platichthys flesus]
MSITYVFTDYYFEASNETFVIDSDTSPCQLKPLEPTAAVAVGVLLIAIFLLAIPGNLLVGWVISTSKQTLSPSDVYLFHLTIADGLIALTLPFWAVASSQGWLFGGFMCKLLSFVNESSFYISIIFLACISIDRYLLIVHASGTVKSRMRMCSRLLCAGVWAFGLALGLPALFNEATKLDEDLDWMICAEVFDISSSSLWRLAIKGFRHMFGFLLPLGVMIVFYSITTVRLLHTRGFQKYRAMKVILAVVIAFLLCSIPYHITMMIDMLMRTRLIQFDCALRTSVNHATLGTSSLALMHSCINPVLYAFVGEKFRKKMLLLFQRKVRMERSTSSRFSRSTSQTSEGNGAFF